MQYFRQWEVFVYFAVCEDIIYFYVQFIRNVSHILNIACGQTKMPQNRYKKFLYQI